MMHFQPQKTCRLRGMVNVIFLSFFVKAKKKRMKTILVEEKSRPTKCSLFKQMKGTKEA